MGIIMGLTSMVMLFGVEAWGVNLAELGWELCYVSSVITRIHEFSTWTTS